MTIQTLISTMNRDEYSFLDDMNLDGEVIVINQNGNEGEDHRAKDKYNAIIYSSSKKGLSNSRNEAISKATADIILTGDDDIKYVDGYAQMVVDVFKKHPSIDIIAFNINEVNMPSNRKERGKHNSFRNAPKNKYYCSVSLAYRRESLKKANISFDPLFGAGSVYKSGEESLLLRDARNKKLSIYESPEVIAEVDFSESSWFTGFDRKYFFDKGAFLKRAYPRTYWIFKYYYIIFKKRYSKLSFLKIRKALNDGIRDYRNKE